VQSIDDGVYAWLAILENRAGDAGRSRGMVAVCACALQIPYVHLFSGGC
jgi:hypothetical protein